MKTLKISIILIALLGLNSCKKGGLVCYRENGEVTTETRNVESFTKISMSTQADVYIQQGSTYSVQVEASSNLQEIITTTVKSNTLDIDLKMGKCLKGNPTIKVYVTAPSIEALNLSGSGNIYAYHQITSSSMDLTISGSGNMRLDSLSTQTITAKISGSGNIDLKGKDTSENLSATISGSGNVNTLELAVNKATVNISGSGNCKLLVKQNLKATISGSGDVLYSGSPIVESSVSGSGSVRPY